MKTWPKLYAKSSAGKIKEWQIKVFECGNFGEIKVFHGYQGGKVTVKTRVIEKGKNIGKVNSTTPFEQACSEAESKWKKKKDKGYVSQISNVNKTVYLPMLAKTYYSKTSHKVVKGEVKPTKIILPIFVQPKLNGVRCLAFKKDGVVNITSRMGKDYGKVCTKLANQLRLIMEDGEIWDGEIYVHGWSFQKIVRAVKKKRADTRKLQFHRYDVAHTNTPMSERIIYMILSPENKYVRQVSSKEVRVLNMIKFYHDQFAQQGYEGIILRTMDGLYKFGHRVSDLMKYKEFEDAEYPIVACKYDIRQDIDDNGNIIQRKCIKYQCHTKNGIHFDVVPHGSLKQRELWWNDSPNIQQLTVRYQELSEDGVPIFPVGIGIRDYE